MILRPSCKEMSKDLKLDPHLRSLRKDIVIARTSKEKPVICLPSNTLRDLQDEFANLEAELADGNQSRPTAGIDQRL